MDTIAAISTPLGEGGIGIIRVSGPSALHIARKVFRGKRGEIRSHRVYHGEIYDPEKGEVIDEVLLLFFKGPHSYTGEDTIEIHGHGGVLVLTRILNLVCREGARLAEPGEFTRRAFLNGRLDLSQAEAVIDVIRAKTDLSLSIAQDQLRGRLSKEINRIKDGLSDLLAHVEAELDFPEEEEDIGELSRETLTNALAEAIRGIESLLSTYREGRALREGLRVVIAGRPNAGKSSLLNALLKEERAIVTPVPGTTRDVIEETINIKGIPVRLMDTAGLRDGAGEIESIGIRLTKERLQVADLVLYVVDGMGDVREDIKILKGIDREVIVVINKKDLLEKDRLEEVGRAFEGYRYVCISALYGEGMDLLEDALYREVVSGTGLEAEAIITRERHRECLEEAKASLLRCEEVVTRSLPKELFATELRMALDRLGRITGEVTTEDILDRIFSSFCVGK